MPKRVSSVPRGGLYLDALGDPGRRGGQPIYAQALVWLGHTDAEVEELFARVRVELGLRVGYEFHARQVTREQWKQRMPQRFFAALHEFGLRAEVWCAGIRKERSGLPLEYTGKRLVNELVARTVMALPREYVEGAPLTIDDQVQDKKAPAVTREVRSAINSALIGSGRLYAIGSVRVRESHQCAGIQLADYLATAIMKPWPDCRGELAQWKTHERWW